MLNKVSAGWVHYKLDRGVDHVLIDEAQDTSPRQWDIVEHIISEFAAGEGARDGIIAHDVCGRRREAVDLLVPGRGAARIRRTPAALQRAIQGRRTRLRVRSPSPIRSAPAPACCASVESAFQSTRRSTGAFTTDRDGMPPHHALDDAGPSLIELWPLAEGRRTRGHRGLARAVRRRLGDEPRGEAVQAHPGRDQAAGRKRHHDRPERRPPAAALWRRAGAGAPPRQSVRRGDPGAEARRASRSPAPTG